MEFNVSCQHSLEGMYDFSNGNIYSLTDFVNLMDSVELFCHRKTSSSSDDGSTFRLLNADSTYNVSFLI